MADSQEIKPKWFEPLTGGAKAVGKFLGWVPGKSTRAGGVAQDIVGEIKNYGIKFNMDRRGLLRATEDGKVDEFHNNKNSKGGGALMHTKGNVGGVTVGDGSFQISRPAGSKSIPANKAMGAYSGWVSSGVDAIAMDIATITWQLFRVADDDNHEELYEHELLDLLSGVNEYQTGVELRFLIAAHLELAGNCYLLKLDKNKKPVKTDSEKPASLYPLSPGHVLLKFDKSQFPYILLEYILKFDGQEHHYKPHQILHIKYPDPNDVWVGIGSIQKIAAWIDVENYATEYNRKFFINGAHIDGMLQSDMTAEDTIDILRTSWENAYSSVDNAHKTPVLPKGVKYIQTSASPKEMDFGGFSDRSRDRILAGMKVSKTILGTAESDTNRATAETADYVFAKRTIRPKMELICAYLNEFLVPLYGDDIYITFENPVPEDAEFRIKEMQAVMGSQPVASANEARQEYIGLGPVHGGDSVMVSNTMVAVGQPRERDGGGGGGRDEDEPKPEEEPKPEDGANMDGKTVKTFPRRSIKRHIGGKKTRGAINSAWRKNLSEMLAERVAAALQTRKRADQMSDDEFDVVYKEFLSRLDHYEKKIIDLLVAINKSQKKEVMENLKSIPGVEKDVDPKNIFDVKKWVDITIEAITPTLTDLGNQEGKAAAELIGKPDQGSVFDDPAAHSALDSSIELLANSYNDTVLEALRQKLDAGIRDGLGYQELADSVSDIYAFQDEKAAMRIARTESVRVANMSTKTTWKNIGVKEVKWYTAEDGDVCPYCVSQNGKVIDINQNFYNEGDVISAGGDTPDTNADYGDIGGPPLHPMCRCYIRPTNVTLE